MFNFNKKYSNFKEFAFKKFDNFKRKRYQRYKFDNFQNNEWMNNKSKYQFMYYIPFLLTPKFLFAAEEKSEKSYNEISNENRLENSDGKINVKSAEALDMKLIIRGEYENRIRAFSSIEKKYSIFAGVKNFEQVRMNYFQFFDSLIPFAYSHTISNKEVNNIII